MVLVAVMVAEHGILKNLKGIGHWQGQKLGQTLIQLTIGLVGVGKKS
jgi:hypothetical protein